MKILIACEYSGRVRDEFIRMGHKVISCDYHSTERPGPHYKGDVRDILNDTWDMIIAHPDCTFMCRSGTRWLFENCKKGTAADRWLQLDKAIAFFNLFRYHPCPKRVIENPVPHTYARRGFLDLDTCNWVDGIGDPTQIIHPWQHGETTKKATGLWLYGVEPLIPTLIIPKHLRTNEIANTAAGPNRWRERSRTFEGIAYSMAMQWG